MKELWIVVRRIWGRALVLYAGLAAVASVLAGASVVLLPALLLGLAGSLLVVGLLAATLAGIRQSNTLKPLAVLGLVQCVVAVPLIGLVVLVASMPRISAGTDLFFLAYPLAAWGSAAIALHTCRSSILHYCRTATARLPSATSKSNPMESLPSAPSTDRPNRLLFKGLLVGALVLLLLIPATLLRGLVAERAGRQQEVVDEVSSKWAGAQTLVGPLLAVPYRTPVALANGKTGAVTQMAYFLPDALTVTGNIQPEERHRSLYTVLLYRSKLRLTGHFSPLPLQRLQLAPEALDWSGAQLLLGLDDPRGLENELQVTWNGTALPLEAGLPENDAVKTGLHAAVPLAATTGADFGIDLALKGSGQLYVTPLGKTTTVTLASPWKSPAFDGQYLPTETAKTDSNGFAATWNVLHVSRPYPQFWKVNSPNLKASAFGVRLVQPADGYAKTERSVKYALLFIALTFAVFFFIEALQKHPVHPLQYLLVGLALCVFYTLLLAISEYTGFNAAYGIATAATVGLIGGYTRSLFRQWSIALGFSGALAGLYGFIYILIQQEDRALLFGAIGLFVILALLMHFSRKIDWYGTGRAEAPGHSNAAF